jgi:hypothetical protein
MVCRESSNYSIFFVTQKTFLVVVVRLPFHPLHKMSPSTNTPTVAGDLRQFLAELQEEGDLLVIKEEVDPAMELAAITRRVYETEGKASLFEDIKGR